ncbi:glycosyltransferase involved in cell wall biosynthesis [Mycobacterium sp. OAS707]|uniref:glycosyltransferase n=1 Tax=unclassified Mycobacterium TaxID=2642494 RepID=UPI001789C9EC|nr:glycosyltransferase [Mycobacterium sp. OAS707]MBE1548001.1 glycosyltransferase involved in cell wall biosynthesis [Mycobacterium sp. OAS707]
MAGVIIHEWISAHGGSEKVFAAMSRAFPDADLRTLWRDSGSVMAGRDISESWLSSTPLRRSKALALPFMPTTWRALRSDHQYDWVLASSHLFAHHARFSGVNLSAPKFVYAYTPARYIWTPEVDIRGNNPLVRVASSHYRQLDRRRAAEAVAIAGISGYVRDRIRRYWNRDAKVIFPPVAVEAIAESARTGAGLSDSDRRVIDQLPAQFILGASRFVPYKGLDKVIKVGELIGLPVVIAGSGPEESRLKALAASAAVPVELVLSPSDALLHALYARTAAYVFPSVEDFGMMPVEAMAAGAPTIVNFAGGAREAVASSLASAAVDFADLHEVAEQTRQLINEGCRPTLCELLELSESRFAERLVAWVTGGPSPDEMRNARNARSTRQPLTFTHRYHPQEVK